jgi:transcriptional regulator with XRE-family HTH domain
MSVEVCVMAPNDAGARAATQFPGREVNRDRRTPTVRAVTETAAHRAPSPVGEVLRLWRRHRRMSQLDLSSATGVTPRHVSFVETGRAAPTREMLDTLADALDMPLRDRNDLYLAAGYAPPYRELGLDAAELAGAAFAVERILDSHEPLPAIVMDRHWNVLRANRGAGALFTAILGPRPPGRMNVLEQIFSPRALRPYVVGWDDLAPALLARAQREAVCGVPHPELAALLTRLRAELPAAATAPEAACGPIVEVAFRVDGTVRRYFSTITTLGTPRDVTLQEIRIELFHPADDATRTHHRLPSR